MPRVEIESLVPAADAADVFTRLGDFARYPEHAAEIESVTVSAEEAGDAEDARVTRSDWTVHFRNGLLCWSELDRRDPAALTIDFEQVDGDFELFTGRWSVTQAGDDVVVRFASQFDLGMPSLAAIVDPVAERALRDTITAVLRGLFGDLVTHAA